MMITEAEAEKLKTIAASHAEEVIRTATEGREKDGRGGVVIQVDPDTEDCKVMWVPLAKIEAKAVREMVRAYDPLVEDLLIIMPVGRLDGEGYLSSTILRKPPQ